MKYLITETTLKQWNKHFLILPSLSEIFICILPHHSTEIQSLSHFIHTSRLAPTPPVFPATFSLSHSHISYLFLCFSCVCCTIIHPHAIYCGAVAHNIFNDEPTLSHIKSNKWILTILNNHWKFLGETTSAIWHHSRLCSVRNTNFSQIFQWFWLLLLLFCFELVARC